MLAVITLMYCVIALHLTYRLPYIFCTLQRTPCNGRRVQHTLRCKPHSISRKQRTVRRRIANLWHITLHKAHRCRHSQCTLQRILPYLSWTSTWWYIFRIRPCKPNKRQCNFSYFSFEKIQFVKEFPQYKCKSMCLNISRRYNILNINCIIHTLN